MVFTQKKPTGLMRVLFRAPIWLYRWNLGWMMGGRFLLLNHIGRKTGLPRQTVLEVVYYDKAKGVYYIAAAWRDKSDWYRNIQQNPTVNIQMQNHKMQALAEHISIEDSVLILWEYAQKHPGAFTTLTSAMIGERLPPDKETCRKVAESIPLISITPTG